MKMMFIFSVSDKGDSEKMNLKTKRLLLVPAKSQRVFLLSNKTLHNLWFQFLLGISVVPRENEDNGYAKFGVGGGVANCNFNFKRDNSTVHLTLIE